MKKKYAFIAVLASMLGISVSGCYVEREHRSDYYRHERPYHHQHRDHDRDHDRHRDRD